MSNKKNTDIMSKFLHDYLPIIVFFVCYKLSLTYDNLLFATLGMLYATFLAIASSLIMSQKIPKVATFSALVLGFFCTLSIVFNDEYFIKIKPTIINLIFATILLYGYYFKRPMLAMLLGEQIKMSTQDWQTLAKRWALFFIFLALLNEIIWRNFSTDFWVKFKVFGMMSISMIFTFSQIPFIIKAQNKIITSKIS